MKVLLAVLALLIVTFPAQAQSPDDPVDVVQDPICFNLRNEAPYNVYGSIVTNYYTTEDGTKARHRSNFKLGEPGTKDENGDPADTSEFCTYGPFLPDRKLELVLKTLVPIFSCKTKIDQGEIVIKGFRKPEGGTNTFAECYE